jgi:hypothetical protein
VELVDPHCDRLDFFGGGRGDGSSDGGDETFDGDGGVVGNGDRPLALHVGHGHGKAS